MNIKDVARLAGVSTSTVSKILNNKDGGISEETRRRVLQIAKENQYSPYSGVRTPGTRRYMLGLTYPQSELSPAIVRSFEEAASEAGFITALVGEAGNGSLRPLAGFVDGALLVSGERHIGAIIEDGVPAVLVNSDAPAECPLTSVSYDYDAACVVALAHLKEAGHRRIGLLTEGRGDWRETELRRGFARFYSDNEIPFDKKLIGTRSSAQRVLQSAVTAVVCETPDLALEFCRFAQARALDVPSDISVVALCDEEPRMLTSQTTYVDLGARELARIGVERLVGIIGGGGRTPERVKIRPALVPGSTVQPPPRGGRGGSFVVVVGPLNEDHLIKVSAIPTVGETILVKSLTSMPGGKGANQAVCVCRLGGEAALIGRVGNDASGKMLYNELRRGGVSIRAVSVDRNLESGKAFINVADDGESFVEVYAGANMLLAQKHIQQHKDLFAAARYCLVQTELPLSVVEHAVEYAAQADCLVICKPCSVDSIPDSIMAGTYIMAPNEKEAARLAGRGKSVEERARWFLDKGCRHVIITLAERGCYYAGGGDERWYQAYREPGAKTVDTTGASDVFLGALAVYLSEEHTISEAIRFAHVAAGLSVTREGVQASAPDRTSVEMRNKTYWLK
ncbi:MAG: PfkB family carbohydrate kinase [Clostridiales bacterium]|jgi:ribokinase|nr:PfkB family carbohydrate kinase [Clostridiales bacterium]